MKFLIRTVEINDRHTEPRNKKQIGLKHEEVTLSIGLIGSGDTREFTNEMLIKVILEQFEVVLPPNGD